MEVRYGDLVELCDGTLWITEEPHYNGTLTPPKDRYHLISYKNTKKRIGHSVDITAIKLVCPKDMLKKYKIIVK